MRPKTPRKKPAKRRLSLADFWRRITQPFHDLKAARAKAGWRPKEISLLRMILILLLEIGIISTITALLIVSDKQSGFVGLNDIPRLTLGHIQLAAEIWPEFFYRALPTFLMTTYGKLREGTLTAVWDRQPYVELAKREQNSSLQKTVLLDYSKVAWWKRGYLALQNSHYVIAACAIVVNIYSFAITPLTSNLFTAAQFDMNNTIPGLVTRAFDGTSFSQDDLRPALDTATSILINGANPPAWTFDEYAFPPFSIDVASTGNVTTDSNGYSANLDCEVISQNKYTTQIYNSSSTTSFNISTNDRGCNISRSFGLPPQDGVTVTFFVQQSCSLQSGISRLVMISWNSTSADTQIPSSLTFISCIPLYWKTPGNLTVNFDLPSEPVVVSFAPQNETDSQFLLDSQAEYEGFLQGINTYDPETPINSNDFGRLVYNYAQQMDPQSPLDAKQLENSTVTTYALIFAAYSSYAFFQALPTPANTTVIVTESVTRLIVVQPIAYIILGIIIMAFLLTIRLFSYTNHPSGLVEEPIGLLGAAALLHESDIMEIVGQVKTESRKRDDPFDGKVIEPLLEKYDLSGVSCYRSGDTPDDSKIIVKPKPLKLKTVEPRVRKARWFFLLRLKAAKSDGEK